MSKKELKVLDLFSGIGGFSLGFERAGMKTIAFCEVDENARSILKKNWPDTVVFSDIRNLSNDRKILNDHLSDGSETIVHDNSIDVICGGFPCQDISVGGNQKGIVKGDRSNLWKEYKRIVNEVRPKYVVIENVERLRKNGLGVVLNDLHQIGYDAEWHCITARSVGYPHQRDRLFIIAYCGGERLNEYTRKKRHIQDNKKRTSEKVHTKREECEFESSEIRKILSRRDIEKQRSSNSSKKSSLSDIRRVTDGIPEGLDEKARKERIKQLGNAIIPDIAEMIGFRLMEIESE